LRKEHASAFFNGTVGTDEVRFEAQTAMSRGISGVPTFILDGEAIFSGALKPDLMAARLREAVFAHERQ
jgi:predicted DsbA family dithiol-disulfide isomerase